MSRWSGTQIKVSKRLTEREKKIIAMIYRTDNVRMLDNTWQGLIVKSNGIALINFIGFGRVQILLTNGSWKFYMV